MTTSIRPEHDQHDLVLAEAAGLGHQQRQFVHELVHIDALGDDQPQIKRRLQPAAPEDEKLHGLDDLVHGGRVRVVRGSNLTPVARRGLPAGCVSRV
jgi:hypothetical protein